jgi:drug/metabolite transporter (DMT)-like permease
MSAAALALILIAAVAHATWNLLSKQAADADKIVFIWLMAAAASVAYLPVLAITIVVVRPQLAAMNWVFMVGTGILEAGYFLFLQSGYRLGDLSVVYPIGRGTGALLAALAGVLLFGERPSPVAIAGIGAIVAGIVLIGLPAKSAEPAKSAGSAKGTGPAKGTEPGSAPPQRAEPLEPAGAAADAPAGGRRTMRLKATAFALATGAFIASYTLWDKYAVSTLRTPAVLQGYAMFPVMVIAFTPLVHRAEQRPAQVWRAYRPQVIGAALLVPLAYMLVLAALSFTAVSTVAPTREVSVLFGVLLGRRLLNEGGLPRRLTAALAIVAGIVAVAVS